MHDTLLLMLCGGGYIPAQRPHVFKFVVGPWVSELEEHRCPLVKDCQFEDCEGNR